MHRFLAPACAGLLVLLPARASAAEAPTCDDCKLALQARQALQRDRLLEPLSVGVSVKARVATVWGSVPERGLADRVLDRVRKVQGMAGAVDQLTIESAVDPLPPVRRQRPPPPEPPTENPPAPAKPPWYAPPTDLATKPAKLGTTAVLPHAPAPVPAQGVSLLPPRSAPKAALNDPSQAVADLCRGERRYRYVRAEVAEGVVRLRGSVVRGEDVFTLAQAIGRVPGVQKVIVDGVRIDPLLVIGRE